MDPVQDDPQDEAPLPELQIPTARVFEPLLQPARYKGAHGGRGSAKSNFFADHLIDRCIVDAPLRAVCIREIQRSLAQSVKLLIEDKIKSFGLTDQFLFKQHYIQTPGGGMIIFNGMRDHSADSIKSLEGFDVAWVEEAQSISERSLELLRPTIRKPGSELWFSWNPRYASDPVDKLLRSKEQPPGAVVVQANWRDNPWFPEELRLEMEYDRRTDQEKYAHIWEGAYETRSEARIFKNWVEGILEVPAGAVPRLGGDWGFAVDPTTAIKLYELDPPMGGHRRRIYIEDEVYQVGCEIDHTPALFDKLKTDSFDPRMWPLVADSARPETISYLTRHGYPRVQAAIKGPNSVSEGIVWLQGYDIIIHPKCKHAIDEFTHYAHKVDKHTGDVLPMLEDKKNHVIDSVRYATEAIRRAQSGVLVW